MRTLASSPGMRCASTRSPAGADGASTGLCHSRSSDPRSELPPGAACENGVRGKRSATDDHATAVTSAATASPATSAAVRAAGAIAGPARRSRPSQSAPVSSAGSDTCMRMWLWERST